MKFKASALAVTAIAAIGLASSVLADANPYDRLGFATNQTYTMTASDTTVTTVGGTWNATLTAVDSKVEIDSDAELPLTFAPASGDAKAATELKFNVEASVVPNSVTLSVPSGDDAPSVVSPSRRRSWIMSFRRISMFSRAVRGRRLRQVFPRFLRREPCSISR